MKNAAGYAAEPARNTSTGITFTPGVCAIKQSVTASPFGCAMIVAMKTAHTPYTATNQRANGSKRGRRNGQWPIITGLWRTG